MPSEPAIRKRAKHTRSKLGCGVCRIRRVRCDRTPPACQRCTSTGRTCDGYPSIIEKSKNGTASGTTKNAPLLPLVPKPQVSPLHKSYPPALTHEEGRWFFHFRDSAAFDLAGEFQGDFWKNLVPRVGHQEPCVRHMIVALSTLHVSLGIGSSTLSPTKAFHDQAIAQYAKALKHLHEHIVSHEGGALHITIFCSLLCIIFEWLRADYSAALVHLRSSLKLLRQWHEGAVSPRDKTRKTLSLTSPGDFLIRNTLFPMIGRMMMEARSLMNCPDMYLPLLSAVDEPQVFTNTAEARDAIFNVLCETYAFSVAWPDNAPPAMELDPDFEPQARWDGWCTRLDRLLANHPSHDPAAITLRIWQKTTMIMIATKAANSECSLDAFNDTFSAIIDLATQLYSYKRARLAADMSVTAVLFFVATKCRHPVLRRRAIALLKASPRREGIWQSEGAALVALEVVEKEETMAGGVVRSERDVGEAARVRETRIDLGGENWPWKVWRAQETAV